MNLKSESEVVHVRMNFPTLILLIRNIIIIMLIIIILGKNINIPIVEEKAKKFLCLMEIKNSIDTICL